MPGATAPLHSFLQATTWKSISTIFFDSTSLLNRTHNHMDGRRAPSYYVTAASYIVVRRFNNNRRICAAG